MSHFQDGAVSHHTSARVLVVGGSPEASGAELLRCIAGDCDVIVAVDRGLDAVLDAGLACDLFVGDADSVSDWGASLVRASEEGRPSPVGEALRFDPHKDDTDLALALRAIAARWGKADIVATCLSGGRPDHGLAVLGRLTAWKHGSISMQEDAFEARFLHGPADLVIDGAAGKTFSFIPLSQRAVVSEAGMRWNLDHREVTLLEDLGVSNVIERETASFSCHDGTVVAWLFN